MNMSGTLVVTTLTVSIAGYLHASAITGSPVAIPANEFQIMTAQEASQHKQQMGTLNGTSREAYRNEQYELLKARALVQGYLLPDVPPWGRTDVLPAPGGEITEATKTASKVTTAEPPIPQTTDDAPAAVPDEGIKPQPRTEQPEQQGIETAVRQEPEETKATMAAIRQAGEQQREAMKAQAALQQQTMDKGAEVEVEATAAQAAEQPGATLKAEAAEQAPAMANTATGPQSNPQAIVTAPVLMPAPATVNSMAANTATERQLAGSVGMGMSVGGNASARAAAEASSSYRELMRSRFDRYMREREAVNKQREQQQAERQKQVQEKKTQVQQRQRAGSPYYGPVYPPARYAPYAPPYWVR